MNELRDLGWGLWRQYDGPLVVRIAAALLALWIVWTIARRLTFVRARLLVARGDLVGAAEVWRLAGNPRKAGDLLSEAGRPVDAGEAYVVAAEFERAAQEFERAKRYAQAGAQWRRAGKHAQAAVCFFKAKDLRNAAESNRSAGRVSLAARQYAEAGALLEAAQAFDSIGARDAEAARVFEQAGMHRQAAEAYAEVKDARAAAQQYLKAGMREEAAAILEKHGAADQAAQLRASTAAQSGHHAEAGRLLLEAGKVKDAAKAFEAAGAHEDAARAWEKAGEPRSAARIWTKAGKHAEAGRLLEKIGDAYGASECYRAAGDLAAEERALHSLGDAAPLAEFYARIGRAEDAIAAAQRVGAGSLLYRPTMVILGRLLLGRGDHAAAAQKLRLGLEGRKVAADTIDAFYDLGRAALGAGERDLARDVLGKVVEVDLLYKDARELHARASAPMLADTDMRPASPAPATAVAAVPQRLGGSDRYRILGEIGRGGMGVVQKAEDTVLGRIVAIKTLALEMRANPTAARYFIGEARAAAQLSHPNVVALHDVVEDQGAFFLVMEFVEGSSLAAWIEKTGPMRHAPFFKVAIGICDGLGHAHERGILHRDVKPGNVILTPDERPKLMDFGLARALAGSSTNPSMIVGTPAYMAPEQLLGRAVDFRTDVYALGVTFFEMLTGSLPFPDEDAIQHVLQTPAPEVGSPHGGLPPALVTLVARCMEKDPDNRPSTVKDVRGVLVAAATARRAAAG